MAKGGTGLGIASGAIASGPITTTFLSTATVLSNSILGQYVACVGGTAYSVTLPSAVGIEGRTLGIRIDPSMTNLVTLTAQAGQLIDGKATRIMWAGESALLVSDGVSWHKLSGVTIPMQCAMRLNNPISISGGAPAVDVAWNQTDIDNTGLMADAAINHRITFVRPGTYTISCDLLITTFAAAGHGQSQTLLNGVPIFANLGYSESASDVGITGTQAIAVAAGDTYSCQFSATQNCQVFGAFSGNSSYFTATEVPSW